MANREDLAWAAGFYDGEGSCGNYTSGAKTGTRARISISQKDREVLDRFRDAVGVGSVNGPHKHTSGAMFKYQVSGAAQVQYVIAQLWPWLGAVKRDQAAGTLVSMRWERPLKGRDRCGRNHPYRGNRNKHGQCVPCLAITNATRVVN